MLVSKLFLVFLLAKLENAHPLDISDNVDLDQSGVVSTDDSSTSNTVSDSDDPAISSTTEQSETQPALYAENGYHADGSSTNLELASIPSDVAEAPSDQVFCNSEIPNNLVAFRDDGESLSITGGSDAQKLTPGLNTEAMTDEVGPDSPTPGAGSMCVTSGPRRYTPSNPRTSHPKTPRPTYRDIKQKQQEARDRDAEKNKGPPPPDCSKMGGNPRVAFCCEQGPALGSRNIYDRAADTRRRKCRLWSFNDPLCWRPQNIFCGFCRKSGVLFDSYNPFFPDAASEPILEPLQSPSEMPPIREIEPSEEVGRGNKRRPGREIWNQPKVETSRKPRPRPGPQNKPEICTSEYLESQGFAPRRSNNNPPRYPSGGN